MTHLYFSFRTITGVILNGFSPNLICALMWKSGLGLLIGEFCQFLAELSSHDMIKSGYYSFTFLFDYLFSFDTFASQNTDKLDSGPSGTVLSVSVLLTDAILFKKRWCTKL